MRAALSAIALLVATNAYAQAPSHTCRPITIGDTVLDLITANFNTGFDNEDPNADVRGFQLHIDRDNNAIPDTSFIKWPDPWPVPGTDARNRQFIGPSSFIVAGDPNFNITMSIDNLNATNMEVGFSCHPDEFGGALKDGAIRGVLDMTPAGKQHQEIQLQFRWHIVFSIPKVVDVDTWITIDLVDMDLPDESILKVIAALVPEVTADKKSVKLKPFVNVDDVASALVLSQLADEWAVLEVTFPNWIADIACALVGSPPLCTEIARPAARVLVGIAFEELRKWGIQKMKDAVSGYVQCFLEPFNRTAGAPPPTTPCNIWSPPAPGENKFVEQLGDRLRGQLAKLELPKRIKELPIPNYDSVAKYEPDLVRNLCP